MINLSAFLDYDLGENKTLSLSAITIWQPKVMRYYDTDTNIELDSLYSRFDSYNISQTEQINTPYYFDYEQNLGGGKKGSRKKSSKEGKDYVGNSFGTPTRSLSIPDVKKFIDKVKFVIAYSFMYSPRPGTPAADKKLNNLAESKERLKKLQSILENFQLQTNENYLKQNCEVLVENKLDEKEKYFGRTKYMTPVIFESDNCKPGELVNVKITSFNQKNLFSLFSRAF